MNKTSEWVKTLNQNSETLKETIKSSEAQSTKEIAAVLASASKERLTIIERAIAEESNQLQHSMNSLFQVKTWRFVIMIFPAAMCAILLAICAYLAQEISSQQAQSEYWTQHMGKADVTTCSKRGETESHTCIRVVTGQTYGEDGDYMVVKGY